MKHKLMAFGAAVGTFIALWAVAAIVISYSSSGIDKVAPGVGSKIKSFFPGVV